MEIDKLDINSFIEFLEEHLRNGAVAKLSSKTNFKELEEWTSLQSLIIIAGISDTFKVSIMSEDLQSIDTISQLYDLVLKRL